MPNQRAEICFHHRVAMDAAAAALIELGFVVSGLGWIGSEEHSAGWIAADAVTGLDHDDFVEWVNTAVRPLHGVVRSRTGTARRHHHQNQTSASRDIAGRQPKP